MERDIKQIYYQLGFTVNQLGLFECSKSLAACYTNARVYRLVDLSAEEAESLLNLIRDTSKFQVYLETRFSELATQLGVGAMSRIDVCKKLQQVGYFIRGLGDDSIPSLIFMTATLTLVAQHYDANELSKELVFIESVNQALDELGIKKSIN